MPEPLPALSLVAVPGRRRLTLDLAAETKPNPARTDTLRRLNRTEYRNAIRDLSPTLMERFGPYAATGAGETPSRKRIFV